MIYDELMAKMDDIDVAISNGFGKASVFLACVKATRAVVELHKPMADWRKSPIKYDVCDCCGWVKTYPCLTLQAIEKAFDDSQAN